MELREWQYINKPASNSSGSNKSFKKRFDKIIKYYGDHLPAEVDYITVNLLTNGSLNFTENYDNGDKVQYDIFIDDFDTEDWGIKIKVNGQSTEKYFDKGWSKLLNTLGAYIELPQAGDPEYTNLLTEWVEMKNNNSPSGSFKKRFEKLIKYHIDHASSELESITKKDIRDSYFHLGEHYNTGSQEFDRDIVVSYDKDSGTFFLRIFVDGKEVDSILRKGYEDFVKAAEAYMFLPDSGTQEYDDLLTESLNEWQLMNPPRASQPASSKTNKEKFTELVSYMQKHKDSSVIFTSVNRPNDTGFEYEEQRAFTNGNEYNLSLEVECKSGDLFFIHLDMDGNRLATKSAVGWEDLLLKIKTHFHVPKTGSPEYKSLTESFSSFADEFKLYENLF